MIPPAVKKRALLVAAQVLVGAAARCYEAATAEGRRLRAERAAEAGRIGADAEAALAEFLSSYGDLAYAEDRCLFEEGRPLPPRAAWELDLYRRLREATAAAVEATDPDRVREAARRALRQGGQA